MGVGTDKEKKDPEHGMLTNKDLEIRLGTLSQNIPEISLWPLSMMEKM